MHMASCCIVLGAAKSVELVSCNLDALNANDFLTFDIRIGCQRRHSWCCSPKRPAVR